jgi:hypothetical protein
MYEAGWLPVAFTQSFVKIVKGGTHRLRGDYVSLLSILEKISTENFGYRAERRSLSPYELCPNVG